MGWVAKAGKARWSDLKRNLEIEEGKLIIADGRLTDLLENLLDASFLAVA
jgi:hypothetical protein